MGPARGFRGFAAVRTARKARGQRRLPSPLGPARILNLRETALVFFILLLSAGAGFCSPEKMKGPDAKPSRGSVASVPEAAFPKIVLLGAVGAFQRYISPTDGDRCGFTPSCSAFGKEAVRRQGPLVGVLMTADRLMRCTFFKRPGPDYLLLPNGRLYDPVENNLIANP
jgi:putative component of membrane protein insertase Oxa1/YidC/SpoIIIJ protein YidD